MSKRSPNTPPLPEELCEIATPIVLQFWRLHLQRHPDRQFAELILSGLEAGFHIGFNPAAKLRPAKTNLISATQHPEIVSNYTADELASGHLTLVGSPQAARQLNIQISSLGVIAKKDRLNKYRLIMDLSSPAGCSVNDGISKEDCSFHYTSVDAATARIVNSVLAAF